MKYLPFSIFKRTGRRFYSVKFKNEETGEYLSAISTKQESEAEAIKTAFEWLKSGIPRQEETIFVKNYSLRDLVKEADITQADVEFVCKHFQQQGFLKSFVPSESKKAIVFKDYLLNMWDWDNSPYIKEKLRKKHGIHRGYVVEMKGAVNRYWAPFFKDKLLGELTSQDVEDFITYLEEVAENAEKEQAEREAAWEKAELETIQDNFRGDSRPTDSAEVSGKKKVTIKKERIIRFPKSPKRKNKILRAGTIALKRAFNKEMIDKDITAGITWFSGEAAERQILSPEQAAAIFKMEWEDERSKLANMLASNQRFAVTGMRAGEIQGLRVQDLGEDCFYLRHSWNFRDGLKTTKNNESRVVEVPFPGLMQELLDLAKKNPHGQEVEDFIFWAEISLNKPMESEIFLRDLRSALVKIGMSEASAKVYTFHGWFSDCSRKRTTILYVLYAGKDNRKVVANANGSQKYRYGTTLRRT
jgi:integrase